MSALCRLAVAGIVSLCMLLGGLVFGSVGALAGVTHEYLSQIAAVPAKGPAPAEEPVAVPGPLGEMHALAVDSGALFVADGHGESFRLDKFNGSSGAFIGQFAQVPSLYYLHDGVAVGHSSGEVYVGGDVADSHEGTVAVFGAGGGLLGTWTGADTPSGAFGCFECAGGEAVVAVDNSGSLGDWAAGDVYVADPEHGVVDVFKPGPGGSEEYVTQLEGSEPGVPFSAPSAVAVDQANGDLVVVEGHSVVDVFEPVSGLPTVYQFLFRITETPTGALGGVAGIAVDGGNGDIYVSGEGKGGWVVDQFGSGGGYLGQLTGTPAGPFGKPEGLAVDPGTHHLFVGDFRGEGLGVVDVFGPGLTIPDARSEPASGVQPTSATLNGVVNPSGLALSDCHFEYGTTSAYGRSVPCAQSLGEIGAGSAPVAVSADLTGLAAGTVYHFRLSAANTNGVNGPSEGQDRVFGPPQVDGISASGEAQTTVALAAQVNPEGVDTTYRFEYGPTGAYGTSVPVPDGPVGAGEGDVSLNAQLTGLQAGVTYHYRIVAVNAAGTTTGKDQTFTTIAPALIDSFTITNVTPTGADVHAQINALGSDTTYRFEYGTSAAYGASAPIPAADIGAGSSDQTVTQQLVGLSPNTTYHVRVVAQNTLGTVRGADHTFIYDTAGGGLPDGRAYEMVTPAHKNGAVISGQVDVAENGSRVMALSIQCFAGATSCTASRGSQGSPYAFSRTGSGWVAASLAPPVTQTSTTLEFNANEGTALFGMLAPPENENDFYARQPDGSLAHIGPVSPPSGGSFHYATLTMIREGTADYSHVVWNTTAISANAGGVWPLGGASDPDNLYEYVGTDNSQPLLVGVSGGPDSTDLISACDTALGAGRGFSTEPGSLSGDGRTVFFTASECSTGTGTNAGIPVPVSAVYARIDESRTVALSAHSPGDCTSVCLASAPSGALFEGASQDGSKAFFTSTQQLTDPASEDSNSSDSATNIPGAAGAGTNLCPATVGPNGCNLYEYDFANPAGHELVDASAGDTSGDGPRVEGVMALSSDGSHVYFVAKGVLAGVANSEGQSAQDGANNLYVFERDGTYPTGHVAFIATLPDSDQNEWTVNPGRPANVTPDGRFLVFTSSGRLTVDDTSMSGAKQVFRYDAGTAQLVRVSIGDDGFDDNGNRSTVTPCEAGSCSEDASIAQATDVGARPDLTMSHDGSYVFFQSPVGLTPRALDDVQISENAGRPLYAQNVYEWHGGHVYLISDGRDTSSGLNCESRTSVCLLGADATGANVFFATADSLVGQDTDGELDIYDARVCSPGDPCIASASSVSAGCQGEGCHGTPPVAPSSQGAATITFSGPGNLVSPLAPVVHKKHVVKKKHVKKRKRVKKGKHVKHRRPRSKRAKGHGKAHGSAGSKGGHS